MGTGPGTFGRLAEAPPSEQTWLPGPFFFEESGLQFDGTGIGERIAEDGMTGLFLKPLLEELDGFSTTGFGEPDFGWCDDEISMGIPLVTIEGADDDQIPKWDAKEFHKVEAERIGGASRSMEEAEGWFESARE